jgi:hypothetical protein
VLFFTSGCAEVCCPTRGVCRQTESVIADLLDDKAELTRQIEDAAQEARLQDEALAHCKATVADLASQLAASYQAREDGVHRVAR